MTALEGLYRHRVLCFTWYKMLTRYQLPPNAPTADLEMAISTWRKAGRRSRSEAGLDGSGVGGKKAYVEDVSEENGGDF